MTLYSPQAGRRAQRTDGDTEGGGGGAEGEHVGDWLVGWGVGRRGVCLGWRGGGEMTSDRRGGKGVGRAEAEPQSGPIRIPGDGGAAERGVAVSAQGAATRRARAHGHRRAKCWGCNVTETRMGRQMVLLRCVRGRVPSCAPPRPPAWRLPCEKPPSDDHPSQPSPPQAPPLPIHHSTPPHTMFAVRRSVVVRLRFIRSRSWRADRASWLCG